MRKHERVALLIEFLCDRKAYSPEAGWTKRAIARELDWTQGRVKEALQPTRDALEHAEFGLACQPGERNGQWIYFLTGDPEKITWWAANRIGDAERRLKTVRRTMQPIVKMTDGRAVQGKKARLIVSVLRFLEEQLEQVQA